jgi:flavin reductase (DIM6/NTAB) family NADH-FMN oxidoreductase RutF
MSMMHKIRTVIKRIAFGNTLLPQEFTLGLEEPQTEITVWLHGAGTPRDVTRRHSMVCASPLTICIGFDEGQRPNEKDLIYPSLKFCERAGQKRVLGEIGLKPQTSVAEAGSEFILFEPRSSKNYCLPRARLCAHYFLHAYRQWKRDNTKGIKMSFLERRAGMVVFICPHPILLVSVGSKADGNIFPMNILGDLGNGYIGFALRGERLAGGLVERAGRIALSSLPVSQGALAYQLANNHTRTSIDWSQLPFATKMSRAFSIPVPEFAPRVMEVEIKSVRAIGSHRFFIARIIREDKFFDGLEFCSIHGFYQSWRLSKFKAGGEELQISLAGDAFNKRGRNRSLAVRNAPIEIAPLDDKLNRRMQG